MTASSKKIPIIDLFAGPGGLGEGFSAYEGGHAGFKIKLSIEKDVSAHKTLRLRSFYRQFTKGKAPKEYYEYISGRGDITLEKLTTLYPQEWAAAESEAVLAELGHKDFPDNWIDKKISAALNGAEEWVLIGGPPCQAYSLVGRARMRNVENFEKDHRHFLYKEYLRILNKFKPSVFVMENVKGLLSSRVDDELIFHQILKDLKIRGQYNVFSLTSDVSNPADLKPSDFIIRTEDYGVPQARHRVILLGVRNDSAFLKPGALQPLQGASVYGVLKGLPKFRSRLSKGEDTDARWKKIVRKGAKIILKSKCPPEVKKICRKVLRNQLQEGILHGGRKPSGKMLSWLKDPKLSRVALNHDPRGHMDSDIQRYLFASCYAAAMGVSPKLKDFPSRLLPAHKNVQDTKGKTETFADRFKVQLASKVSSTVVSHIAKDGHYYIHPDPMQCRSLTVREAARLQTFPDNYFFEGNRTQQYTQVGNAVPPYLALQIAEVVARLLAHKQKLQARSSSRAVAAV